MRPGKEKGKAEAKAGRDQMRLVQQEGISVGEGTGLQGTERQFDQHLDRGRVGARTEETQTYIFT